MNLPIDSIVLSVLTASVIGIFGVAWRTYNKFLVMIAQFEFVIDALKKSDETHKEIFLRLREIENKITKLESK